MKTFEKFEGGAPLLLRSLHRLIRRARQICVRGACNKYYIRDVL
jgi:hypothetical protein